MSDEIELGQGYERRARKAAKGPLHAFFVVFWLVLAMSVVIGGTAYVFGWFGEAASVAQEQFGPRATVQKYEWFKDAAAQLTAKKNDIEVLQTQLDDFERDYEGTPKADWPRDERQSYNQRRTELSGLKMAYNSLAAEYNAAHAKINWAYADVGKLPSGASDVLPREVAEYQNVSFREEAEKSEISSIY